MMEDILITELMTEFQFESPKQYKVKAFVLDLPFLQLKEGSKTNICGLCMLDWVCESLKKFETKIISVEDKNFDIYKELAKHVEDEDYDIVLFSSTPLVEEKYILEVLDYAQTKKLDMCKLPKGFIFRTNALKKGAFYLTSEPQFLDKSLFFNVVDTQSLESAMHVLNNRILSKLQQSGVCIVDKNTTFVDATVVIDAGVTVSPFNIIKGTSRIKSGTILKEFNNIENCKIGENCVIQFSNLKNTVIQDNKNVGPFENITKKG